MICSIRGFRAWIRFTVNSLVSSRRRYACRSPSFCRIEPDSTSRSRSADSETWADGAERELSRLSVSTERTSSYRLKTQASTPAGVDTFVSPGASRSAV